MHRASSFLALCLLLAGCDSGTSGVPTIDGQSETAFDESVEKVRDTLTPDDADRFDAIVTAKRWKGKQSQIHGLTGAEVIAQAEAEAAAENERMAKYQQLTRQMNDLDDLKLPEAEHKTRRQAILREIKALGINIPDSAFEN